jgi:CheY-like chemotaxis protein
MKSVPQFTLLLVEDHDDSREAIKYWLEKKGWHVVAAGDQKTALALARKHAIDLLVCDLQLPDGDGWELMKQLQTIRPVLGIITSGHGFSST